MNWWLIAVLVLIAIMLFKFKEIRHKLGLGAIVILILFLVASFGQLYATHNLDLTSFDGIVMAGKVYFSWLGSVAKNVANIGGYAIKQDWGVNVTNVSGDLSSAGNAVIKGSNFTRK